MVVSAKLVRRLLLRKELQYLGVGAEWVVYLAQAEATWKVIAALE